METLDPDEANVPWGKYSYNLEGLAMGCYMEGVDPRPRASRLPSAGQRIRFRIELPARCFVLSVAVKLPNAPASALPALNDIVIERALSHGEFQVVFDPAAPDVEVTSSNADDHPAVKALSGDSSNDSPTSIEQTSSPQQNLSRKKVLEVRRAANSLRLTMTDIDDASASTTAHPDASDSDDASDSLDQRTLGIVVIGYTRGQTPAFNRLRILLTASARLPLDAAKVDRAEITGLLGLAFLGSRRYRQAAELLQRAAEQMNQIARDDAIGGFQDEDTVNWAAELNLLSAHAYFEHMSMCNDGIIRLIQVASAFKSVSASQLSPRDVRDLSADFLDLRTELLNMLDSLINMLVSFLADSSSPAVRMAAARMIEFISEQLGCGMAPHMATILNTVLRSYPSCVAFGARERAAAASFSYDSMEDCFERLTDICCRLFPLTEHTVLHRLYDNTLVPVFLDAFHESDYLHREPETDISEDIMSTSVAQTLRVLYLSLMVLGADARIPTSLLSRILNILVLDNGLSRTTLVLRRTALHSWDAVSRALAQSALGNTVKPFEEHLKMLTSYFPKLLVETVRVGFEYSKLEDDNGEDIPVFKEEQLNSAARHGTLDTLLKKRKYRTEIADRHTLRRVLTLITSICDALNDDDAHDDDFIHSEVVFVLQERLGLAIADLAMSSLLDVSYHEAVVSGNGTAENNVSFEFGHIDNQLGIVSEVLQELFACYWACLSLLPSRLAEDTVRTTAVRTFLGWCVDRMKQTSPPKGMLRLMCVCVKGLMNQRNTSMFGVPKDSNNPGEVTFLSIYRAHLVWLPQTEHGEAFNLLDLLNENVAGDLLANDILLLIKGLGNQRDEHQSLTESSLESLATIIAAGAPRDPDLAVKSLKELSGAKSENQRLSKAFPKTARNGGSFNRKVGSFTSRSRQEPLLKSFYLHVVLSSCFDRFDALAKATQQRAGPTYMGDKIDGFVEHAAFVVRCLHVCARSQSHREYVGAILGDIFGTCLAMEDHTDGRVRLAGFEIFAAALDVLFLAQKATMLGSQQLTISANDNTSVLSMPSTPTAAVQSQNIDDNNGLIELTAVDEEVNGSTSTSAAPRSLNVTELAKSINAQSSFTSPRLSANGDKSAGLNTDDDDKDGDQKMNEILAEGGSWRFRTEDISLQDLAFEERAWQMLCAFISSSLGIGRFVDFVVQRACLEYLRNCMMNALRGRSSGASVISFEHIEVIWEAVSRLVGSPWRALNSLAMWVICAVVNVSVYATVTKGRGAARQRNSQLNDFMSNRVFQRAESLLKSNCRESRIWGMQLLEVYIRSRHLNSSVVQVIPPPPSRVLRCLHPLKNDWDKDVRTRRQSLLEVHFSTLNRKSTNLNSFTAQAQSFISIKRHMLDEYEASDTSRVELWFPPLTRQLSEKEMHAYHLKLESFASVPIASGEEISLVKTAEENSDDEGEEDEEEEGNVEDDEEGYVLEGDADNVNNSVTKGEEEVVAEIPKEENEDNERFKEQTSIVDERPIKEESPNEITDDWNEGSKESPLAKDPEEHESSSSVISSESVSENEAGRHADSDDSAKIELSEANNNEIAAEDDDEVDDHEFTLLGSPSNSKGAAEDFVTEITGGEVDEFGIVPIKTGSDVEEDDVEDDELVVNVTDEDDVLIDVDSIPDEKVENRMSVSSASFSVASPSQHGKHKEKTKRSSTWSQMSSSEPNVRLNPDLDESIQVLRRKGSFTSRPSKLITIEEGDAPKLERRRSVDVGALAGNLKIIPEAEDTASKSSTRFSRRKSMASSVSSPRVEDASRSKGADGGFRVDKGNEGSVEGNEVGEPHGVKLPRRKSLKNVVARPDEKEENDRKTSPDRVKGPLSDTGKNDSIERGFRAGKGPKIEDNQDGEGESRLSPFPSIPGLYGSVGLSKERAKYNGGSRITRRSLPRAPAFVKGGGLQRRNSGSSYGSTPEEDNAEGTSVSGNNGSLSSPSLPVMSGKMRVPRGKSQTGRSGRGTVDVEIEGLERRPDRSHRYARREAFKLILDDSDEFDKHMLSDLDESTGQDVNKRPSTPTSESSTMHNTLIDEMPASMSSSYKRRGSKRDVAGTPHFRKLMDELGGTPDEEPATKDGNVHESTSP